MAADILPAPATALKIVIVVLLVLLAVEVLKRMGIDPIGQVAGMVPTPAAG